MKKKQLQMAVYIYNATKENNRHQQTCNRQQATAYVNKWREAKSNADMQ